MTANGKHDQVELNCLLTCIISIGPWWRLRNRHSCVTSKPRCCKWNKLPWWTSRNWWKLKQGTNSRQKNWADTRISWDVKLVNYESKPPQNSRTCASSAWLPHNFRV